MNNKRIEKAVDLTLSEYFDSHLTIGVTPKGDIIISENIKSQRDNMVIKSILEDITINMLPPLDEQI